MKKSSFVAMVMGTVGGSRRNYQQKEKVIFASFRKNPSAKLTNLLILLDFHHFYK